MGDGRSGCWLVSAVVVLRPGGWWFWVAEDNLAGGLVVVVVKTVVCSVMRSDSAIVSVGWSIELVESGELSHSSSLELNTIASASFHVGGIQCAVGDAEVILVVVVVVHISRNLLSISRGVFFKLF